MACLLTKVISSFDSANASQRLQAGKKHSQLGYTADDSRKFDSYFFVNTEDELAF